MGAFLLLVLVASLEAALYSRPPVLVAAFNEEVRRVNASAEDIIQYEAQVWQEKRLAPVRRIQVRSGTNAVYAGHSALAVPNDYPFMQGCSLVRP